MKKWMMLVLMTAVCGTTALATEKPRPNLIVILADDMGIGDIGAFRQLYPGGPEDVSSALRSPIYPGDLDLQLAHKYTPNLDRLAKEGIRCTRAYSGAWCAPSRQMLLSGQWSNRANAFDHPWIGSQLRKEGYVTGFVGKSHGEKPTSKVYNNTNRETAEFDDGLFFNDGARAFYMKAGEVLPGRRDFAAFKFRAAEGDYITDVFTDHAVEFIKRHAPSAGSGQAKPFMLYVPYTAPHDPLHGKPDDLRTLFPGVFDGQSDAEIQAKVEGKKFMNMSDEMKGYHFAAMVYGLDRGVGRILQTLREQGIDQNTLIVFSADNGAQFGCNYPGSGHKSETRDGGIRVPFIVWSAAIARSDRSGSVYNGLLSLADIAPTLMAQATDKPYPYPTDGTDMMPYLTGERKPLTGRTYFWADVREGASVKNKLDGSSDFTRGPLPEAIMLSVLVKDDEKITCWNAMGTDEIGAVYNRIPDVAGTPKPNEQVIERPPVAGQIPVEGRGRALFDEMIQMVLAAEGGLTPEWSGTPAPADKYKWWMTK